MKIPRTLAAVSLTAIVALTAACTNGGDKGADESGSGSQGTSQQQGAASDAGGAQSAQQPDLSDVPDPVAVVNGEKISKDEFTQSYQAQYQQASMSQQSGGQAPDEDKLKKQVADLLVDNHLLTQAADDAGIKASDKDIDKTLDQVAQQNGMSSADEVVKALKEQGSSEKKVRQDAASQYELTAYIDKKAKISDPSEKELKQQYEQLKKQSSQSQQQSGASDAGGGSAASQQVPSFDKVKDQLAQQSKTQQEGEAAQKIATDLRKDADVKINV